MGRKAHFSNDQFLQAAMEIIAEDGPGAITVAAVAKRAGAPVGSVYHRFASLDLLMGELWLGIAASFQEGFFDSLNHGGLSAALYTLRWVREYPSEARVLLLYRREELMVRGWPASFNEKTAALSQALDCRLRTFAEEISPDHTPDDLGKIIFVLIDVPLAVARRYLEAGKVPPEKSDAWVNKVYDAVLGNSSC